MRPKLNPTAPEFEPRSNDEEEEEFSNEVCSEGMLHRAYNEISSEGILHCDCHRGDIRKYLEYECMIIKYCSVIDYNYLFF